VTMKSCVPWARFLFQLQKKLAVFILTISCVSEDTIPGSDVTLKYTREAGRWWLTPVILATQEDCSLKTAWANSL
jgi:hypothetical protein